MDKSKKHSDVEWSKIIMLCAVMSPINSLKAQSLLIYSIKFYQKWDMYKKKLANLRIKYLSIKKTSSFFISSNNII